jgi:large subunit ribosomal protein L9
MEVILKQDIPNLGYKNDLIKVKAGYARNYLIPKGLAILATETNKKVLAEVTRQKAFKEDKIKNEAEEVAKALEGIELKIGAKSGTSGKIFGSVNAVQIANAIKENHNMDIDRKLIHVDGESIKELGEYTAKVMLHKEVEVDLKFEVIAE